ncbi:DUF2993 domain-containing protein [Streptomyces griseorubiginosus]|uniref:LmeA family phospholipid-binding protein n=1 Tax=Streptomyces griseorubiginosus TaxID=67304 RepID=UPI002E823543|nr:DUF2993 domain-containing protein [Streptomyces griseorubiginosus]WUB46031.1 DUF2993 domain-containing protein [Streptomyces griseorubiginosus]WUB54552.1 DUF2993 domain-containing protein [Streptomyces griseorubiginosus]
MRSPHPVPTHPHPFEAPPAPPTHRRTKRRGRRGRFAFAVKTVASLAVLAAFLTLADRWAVLYAEHRAADTLKQRLRLTAAPEVEIGGFPFLTQLADRRLESVQVTVPDVAADRVTLAAVSATGRDIRLDGDGPTSVRGARVPELHGDVLLSFADMNRELGASQVTFTGAARDRVAVRGTLPVAGHDLRLRADVRVARDGRRGVDTRIGGIRLDIGDLATYRPGTRPAEGLHLTPASAAALARETRKARALLAVPSVVRALGVPDATVREAQRSDTALARLTGRPEFVRQALRLNLLDLALAHPELLSRLGLDPALLDALSHLTRPALADRLSLAFQLPEPSSGELRLRDVRVERDGIRVRITGSALAVGS